MYFFFASRKSSFNDNPESVFQCTFNQSLKSVRSARFVIKRIEKIENRFESDREFKVQSVQVIMPNTQEMITFHPKWNQPVMDEDAISLSNISYAVINEKLKKSKIDIFKWHYYLDLW